MKKLKIAISIIALGATALTAFSQGVPPSGSFTATTLTLPYSTLAAATGTNLANGWSTIISVTNTATTWNVSSNAFVTVTNVISATNTAYANMSVISQKDLGVVIYETAGIGTNTLYFGRGIDSASVDTNNTATLTIAHTAAGGSQASTNFPSTWIGGHGVVQITSNYWNAASAGVTNGYIKFGKIVGLK